MTTRALQQASLLILAALAAGRRPGYRIITDVRQISGGRVRLRPGTLYTAPDRLRAEGLVGVDREEIVGNRLYRYYRLTAAGPGLSGATAIGEKMHPAAAPDLRIGHADRDAAAAALGEHFAQGRLTFDELLAARCHLRRHHTGRDSPDGQRPASTANGPGDTAKIRRVQLGGDHDLSRYEPRKAGGQRPREPGLPANLQAIGLDG